VDTHLKRLQNEIQLLTTLFTAEELSWHPPGKWSAGEILEHLYLTYTGTSRGFSRVLASGVVRKRQSWKQRAATLLVLELGYCPNGIQAPAFARPGRMPLEKIVSEIGVKLAEMDAVLADCASRFGLHAKVMDHPLMGPFSIAQWRKFHLRHGLHHLKQIQRLRRSMLAAAKATRS
jgi:hypothetical protein